MSIQLDSSIDTTSSTDTLDRTDELPVLDVEAYEATLAENQKGLSRTDTWTVDALRDIDELIDSATHEAAVDVRQLTKESVGIEAFTVNVDRILKRIADLEADIVAAHAANAVLQKRNEAAQLEQELHVSRAQALEAENARLVEHRTLADEMAQRFERQLRETSQRHDAQLKELHSAHAAERSRADEKQKELDREISRMAAEAAAAQQEHRTLQDRLHASLALADSHAKALAVAQRSLSNEKASAADLARRFAAKLTEYDKLASILEQHNHTIDDLIRVRDDFEQRLQREIAAGAERTAQLAAAEQSASENRALLLEREKALAEEDRQQALLLAEIHELRGSLEAMQLRVTDARRELSAATTARADEERRRIEQEVQLRDMQDRISVLGAEENAAQAQIRSLSKERDSLLPAAADLAARTAELRQSALQLAKLRGELAAAQDDAQASARLVEDKADELAVTQARLGEYETAMREIMQAAKAREELESALQAQLQTAHDECAIMADQRDKARARTKHLTQEIFRRDHQIAELEADLAVHVEALAAIRRDVNRIGEIRETESANEGERILDPVEHAGPPILLTGSMLTVGRTAENDICLPSKLVSRHHARLLIGPTGIIVEDAGSTNGCFVNGEQIRQHLMRDGDVLELGDLRYRLRTRSARDTSIRANVVPLFDGHSSDRSLPS